MTGQRRSLARTPAGELHSSQRVASMQLTLFTDYSLRVLLFVAAHPGRTVAVSEIARAYGISSHHLMKVAQKLVQLNLVEATRGRNGGLRLKREPSAINLGELVRRTEPNMTLVECFDPATNTCPIAPACGLKSALAEAQRAFLTVLDGYTLADFAHRATKLQALWKPLTTERSRRGSSSRK